MHNETGNDDMDLVEEGLGLSYNGEATLANLVNALGNDFTHVLGA